MNEVVVRRARSADAPAVAQLSDALGYPVTAEMMQRRLEEVGHCEDRVVFVAEADGQLVGWVEAAERSVLVAGGICEICGLVVDASKRTSGLGRRLVAEVERWAHERGFEQITVRSNVARPESHPFYERLGFTRTKTQHVYRKKLD